MSFGIRYLTLACVAVAALLSVTSMLMYPGGTPLDATTHGYLLTQNFLSDLGMTVSYSHESNRLGALLFVLSLLAMVIGVGGALIVIVRRIETSRRARAWSRAAIVVAVIASLALVGVAATPENSAMALHVQFTLFAFRVLPVAAFLVSVAALRSEHTTRPALVVWTALTALLLIYAGVQTWGPRTATMDGLRVQVIAQKCIAIIVASALLWLQSFGTVPCSKSSSTSS